jgi:hypothetical protein
MKVSVNAVIQALGSALVVTQMVTGFIPPKYAAWGAAAVTTIQSLTAILAHFRNPDGTPARVAYEPEAKR